MGDDIAVAGVRFKLAEESNIYSELTEKACHGSGLSTEVGNIANCTFLIRKFGSPPTGRIILQLQPRYQTDTNATRAL